MQCVLACFQEQISSKKKHSRIKFDHEFDWMKLPVDHLLIIR